MIDKYWCYKCDKVYPLSKMTTNLDDPAERLICHKCMTKDYLREQAKNRRQHICPGCKCKVDNRTARKGEKMSDGYWWHGDCKVESDARRERIKQRACKALNRAINSIY